MDTLYFNLQLTILNRLSLTNLIKLARSDLNWYQILSQQSRKWWVRRRSLHLRFSTACSDKVQFLSNMKWYYNLGAKWCDPRLFSHNFHDCIADLPKIRYLIERVKLPCDLKLVERVRCNYLVTFRYLVNHLGVTAESIQSHNVLIPAITGDSLANLRYLVEKIGLTIDDIRIQGPYLIRLYISLPILRYLVEHLGLTREDILQSRRNVLSEAATYADLNIFRYLIERVGLTVDDVRLNDNEALRTAATYSAFKMFRYLIEQCALTAADASANNNEIMSTAQSFALHPLLEYLKSRLGLN